MTTLGAFEAKTHLASLLERVERGEEISITKHGRPVARLVPAARTSSVRVQEVIAKLKHSRKGRRLAPLRAKDLIAEGRR